MRRRVLLGSGQTPWAAVVDLANEMHAERAKDDSILRARASEDVQMRLIRVNQARWIVEATWNAE